VSLLANRRCAIVALAVLLIVLVGLLSPPNPAIAQSTVALDTTSGPPGTKVTATGSRWSAGHEVKVQWGGAQLAATTVDDNGSFTVSFTVPDDAAEGQHTVYFYDVPPDGGLGYFIPANFTVTAPAETPPPEAEPSITLDPKEGPRGTEVTVQGSGWIAGDTIIIHFAISGNEVVQATVEDDGSFETTFTVPADAEIGDQKVIAGNFEASWQADAIFRVTETAETPPPEAEPTITLDPTEGPPGTEVIVQGSGWVAGETVIIQFSLSRNKDDLVFSEVVQATVEDDGSFETTFTVPADAPIGVQEVIVGTARVSRQKDAVFRVTGEPSVTVEGVITDFLRARYGRVTFPVATDDLTVLIERDVASLDVYADLSGEGDDVEGVTDFFPSRNPGVKIDHRLTEDERRENRLRTTLTHEFGHVRFHQFLWAAKVQQRTLFKSDADDNSAQCRREGILGASAVDWMEWQAGYASGAFLMPITPLKKIATDFLRSVRTYSPLSPGDDLALQLMGCIQQEFQVSQDPARVRLSQKGYFTEKGASMQLFWS
jgi:hypothetical protein